MPHSFTLFDEDQELALDARVDSTAIRLRAEDVRDELDWELKAEGLCRDNVCVPVRDREALVGEAGIDLAALASLLGRPLAFDLEERVAVLGTAATERFARLRSLEAPDFTLNDLSGRSHTLSAHRGSKVLLIAYASW